MTNQNDPRRKSRRDLLLILLILPFGILCMLMAGQAAIKLAPNWALPANMLSNLDPNTNFAGLDDRVLIEPLNPGILTQPVWDKLFMTPNALIPTREVTEIFTPIPVRTQPPENEIPERKPSPIPTATLGGPIIPPTIESLRSDLSITKTDFSNTYSSGTTISYTIVVTNNGPDEAEGFLIRDNFPANITDLTVNCNSGPGVTCGVNASTGNIILFRRAALAVGRQITITVSGLVPSGVTGYLSNTARVIIPSNASFNDFDISNNSATDTDIPYIDLQITKDDGGATFVPGGTVGYTVTVTNNSTFDLTGIGVSDPMPAQFTSWEWCVSPPCPGAISTDFNDTIDLTAGSSLVYNVVATVSGTPGVGDITNIATVSVPAGLVDADTINNSATETTPPEINLAIIKDDGVATYTPGGTVTYTVTVTNNSGFDLTGITISDPIPTLVTTWDWICITANPSCDGVTNSNTDFTDTIDLAASGGSLTYNAIATVNNFAAGTLENTASVSPPTGLVDTDTNNNTATDLDVSDIGEPEVGPPDGNIYNIPDGTTATFFLSQAIIADGDTAADFVFYELQMGPGINLDHIVIEISSDGSTWYPVFFWGDNIADTNTNVDNVNIPNIAVACPTEVDNCSIDAGDLYNSTGITIDVDNSPLSSVPGGNYFWIRFTEPGLPTSDNDDAHVDAIEILP